MATSGSALPVMAVCCIATRMPASMSTNTFSSRERDSDCISSSSWLRWIATSATRASSSATLAAVASALSCDCFDSNCASLASLRPSSSRLTISCSIAMTRCCVFQARVMLTPASTASTAANANHQRTSVPSVLRRAGVRSGKGRSATGGSCGGSAEAAALGWSFKVRLIVCRRPRWRVLAATATPVRNRHPEPGWQCAGAWPEPWPQRAAPQRSARGALPSDRSTLSC